MFLPDTRAIAHSDRYTVQAQRCEVMFRDGSAIGLHPVAVDGYLHHFLRATRHEGLAWVIFDVRHLASEIELDMKRLEARDHPGLVFYTLRGLYHAGDAFRTALLAKALHTWWPAPPAATVTTATAATPQALAA